MSNTILIQSFKPMTVRRPFPLLLLTSLAFVISACCSLRKLTISPEISSADLKAKSFTGGKIPVTFEFECCPSKEQQAIALKLQQRVAQRAEDVFSGKISAEDYNAEQEVIAKVLDNIVLKCKSMMAEKKSGDTPAAAALVKRTTQTDVDAAWQQAAELAASLERGARKFQ
ncbi:MAG TPA: hypothetical protein VG796_08085 [Verrucomicrobiales bacterium]|nr:hypothetical protein [Verrucomicrobiales bacterium]